MDGYYGHQKIKKKKNISLCSKKENIIYLIAFLVLFYIIFYPKKTQIVMLLLDSLTTALSLTAMLLLS